MLRIGSGFFGAVIGGLFALCLLWSFPVFAEDPAGDGAAVPVVPATPPAPATAPSPKLTLVSDDGNNSLTFGLTTQMAVEFYSKDNPSSGDRDNTTKLAIRRIRPSLSGSVIDKNLTYRLHLDLAPGKLEILDVYLNYAFHPQVQLMGGVYKLPFTRYRIQSYSRLTTIDWSIASRTFGGERQYGLMVHNGYGKAPLFEYEFGVFTGENSRASQARGIWQNTGERADNPSSLTDPGVLDEFHPAFAGRFAYNANGIDVKRETDRKKSAIRYSLGMNMVWDPRANAYRDYTLRAAPEFLLKLYGWSLGGIYYLGCYKQDEKLSKTKLALHGLQVTTGYLVHEKVEIAALFAAAWTTATFRNEAAERAQKLISDASSAANDPTSGVSAADAKAVEDQYKKAGTQEGNLEATLALNVFLLGDFLVWQTDTSWLRTDLVDGTARDDWRVRTQMQLSF
jgi:hypothetical protein